MQRTKRNLGGFRKGLIVRRDRKLQAKMGWPTGGSEEADPEMRDHTLGCSPLFPKLQEKQPSSLRPQLLPVGEGCQATSRSYFDLPQEGTHGSGEDSGPKDPGVRFHETPEKDKSADGGQKQISAGGWHWREGLTEKDTGKVVEVL